jgi:hypothetical protein
MGGWLEGSVELSTLFNADIYCVCVLLHTHQGYTVSAFHSIDHSLLSHQPPSLWTSSQCYRYPNLYTEAPPSACHKQPHWHTTHSVLSLALSPIPSVTCRTSLHISVFMSWVKNIFSMTWNFYFVRPTQLSLQTEHLSLYTYCNGICHFVLLKTLYPFVDFKEYYKLVLLNSIEIQMCLLK